MGGFNDKEHRYFGRVLDWVKNVFFGSISMGLYNPDAILAFEGFLFLEILKGEHETRTSGRR